MNTMQEAWDIAVPFLHEWEKCRLKAYRDQGNVWTIGWGCTGKGITQGTVWTQDQADSEFLRRLTELSHDVMILTPGLRHAMPNQIAAVLSFVFNIGISAYSTSTARKRINEHDWGNVIVEIKKWHHVKGKDSLGLKRRRAGEIKLITMGG